MSVDIINVLSLIKNILVQDLFHWKKRLCWDHGKEEKDIY